MSPPTRTEERPSTGTTARFNRLMRATGRDLRATRPSLALLRAADRARVVLEAALIGTDLTPQKFNVLMELASMPGGRLPLCQLAERLIRSAPNVSGLIDRMETQGLVRRVRADEDRRVVFAEITEAGWDALPDAAQAVFAAEQEVFSEVGMHDRRVLAALLGEVAPD